jgi:hypothetical protein
MFLRIKTKPGNENNTQILFSKLNLCGVRSKTVWYFFPVFIRT